MTQGTVGNKKRVSPNRKTRKPVALTVKIDDATYVRLGMLRASQRRTHQDILEQALREYLDRQRA